MSLPDSNKTQSVTSVIAAGADQELATLGDAADQLGLNISDAQARQLLNHLDLLVHWNRRLNLTAITARNRMLVEHVLDSLSVVPYLHGKRVLDIGSGGGFPGIALAIGCPDRTFTLLDSRGRRVEFLRHVVARLGLTNVSVIKSRVEDYRPAEKFDTLVCRAFASLQEMLELTDALHLPGAQLLAMKGRKPDAEIALLSPACTAQVVGLTVPMLDAERHLVRIEFSET